MEGLIFEDALILYSTVVLWCMLRDEDIVSG